MAPQDFRTRRVRAATPPARGALSRRGCQRISFRWRPKRDGRGSISCYPGESAGWSPLVSAQRCAGSYPARRRFAWVRELPRPPHE
jgi:hypothetical protein